MLALQVATVSEAISMKKTFFMTCSFWLGYTIYFETNYTVALKGHAMSYKNVYHEILLEHYHHSRHKGVLDNPSISTTIHNPSCGDSVIMQALLLDGVVTHCRFQAQGCVISCAAASLLAQKVEGQKVTDILTYSSETMLTLVGLQLGPTRMRCALLALEALQTGIGEVAKKE